MLELDIAYLFTKFDHCGFSCSKDIVGAHQRKAIENVNK